MEKATTNNRGDLQDKVRSVLLSYGKREIDLTIDDLIGKTGLSYSQIYQALYRLQRLGELEIVREEDPESFQQRVSGIRLARMESTEKIYARTVDRESSRQVDKEFNAVSTSVPNILDYMNQKLAIEKARLEITKANIDPDTVITFSLNPIGEEALYLLSKLQEMIEANRSLTNDLEAEKRNAEFYKKQVGSTIYGDSGT